MEKYKRVIFSNDCNITHFLNNEFPWLFQVIFEGKFYSTQAITTSNIQAMDLILEHNNTWKKYTDYRHFLDLS